MKKNLLYPVAILCAMAVTFTSCGKDPEDKLETITVQIANVEDLPSNVGIARAAVENQTVVFADRGANNAFTLLLDSEPNNLKSFVAEFELGGLPGINVSDNSVRVGLVTIQGFPAATTNFTESNRLGNFWFETAKMTDTTFLWTFVEHVFVDNDLKITGKFVGVDEDEDPLVENWNVDLKKGWNRIYITEFYFFPNDEDFSTEITVQSTAINGLGWVFWSNSTTSLVSKSELNRSKARSRLARR